MAASVTNAFSDLFYGNPFSTPIGSLVEESTESFVGPELFQLITEVCSHINQSPSGPKDAIRAIRRRFVTSVLSDETVAMHTLLLLEACVENCGYRFHVVFATRDNLRDFAKFASPDTAGVPDAVRQKLLSLIQVWAFQFRKQVDFQELRNVYTELRARGANFPPPPAKEDQSATAPETCSASIPDVQPQSQATAPSTQQAEPQPPSSTPAEHSTKLDKDLAQVRVNICVLSDLIDEVESGAPSAVGPEARQLMSDIVTSLQEMSIRLIQAISCWETYQESLPHRGTTDATLLDLINVNDELHTVLLRYSRSVGNKQQGDTTLPNVGEPTEANTNSTFVNGSQTAEFGSFVGEQTVPDSRTSPSSDQVTNNDVTLVSPTTGQNSSDPAKDVSLIDF